MSSVSLDSVAELRALAHPARLDLLDLFRVHDRLTAAECARVLGTSTKSCSYHFGILARGGVVVPVAQPSGDGRERPWRGAADEFVVPADAGGGGDRERVTRVAAQRDHDLFAGFVDHEATEPDQWRDSVTVHARTAVMSADQPREWGETVEAVTREHVRRARRRPSQHRRPARLLIRGFPQEFAPERASD